MCWHLYKSSVVANSSKDQCRNGGPRGEVTWHWPPILRAAGPRPQPVLSWVHIFTTYLCHALCSGSVVGAGDITGNKADKSLASQSLYSDMVETVRKQAHTSMPVGEKWFRGKWWRTRDWFGREVDILYGRPSEDAGKDLKEVETSQASWPHWGIFPLLQATRWCPGSFCSTLC